MKYNWLQDNQSYNGYKNHVEADATSKIIVNYKATDATVHDYDGGSAQ